MNEQNQGRLIKRSLYEEYETGKGGGLCFDPHDPAFLGTIALAVFGGVVLLAIFKPSAPTVIYPPSSAPSQTIINN